MAFNDLCESVKSRNDSLVQENKSRRDENKSLMDSNKNLTQRVGDLQQYSWQNNVEIKGIPINRPRKLPVNCTGLRRKDRLSCGCCC